MTWLNIVYPLGIRARKPGVEARPIMVFIPPFSIPDLLRRPEDFAAAAAGTVALVGLAVWLIVRGRLTPAQREARRRNRLAAMGRIIDGTLIDTAPENEPPRALIYRYRVSGVTYECGQDITTLAEQLSDLGPATAVFGLPVQVRYDRDNPADSIVVSETWNGLWNRGQHIEHEH